ncbi:MAG: cupin domain-containing protein [Pseudomonadales bacterium]
MQPLNGLATAEEQQRFVSQYWQSEHRYFKGALTEFEDPITADELAGLACEPEIVSRIVSGPENTLELGPFSEQRLQEFEPKHSTLLVQGVELFVPALVALRDAFNFIPSWRFEDVMVSFATPNGGVGPHFDQYDVFLVQGEGSRDWQVGQNCDEHSEIDSSSGQRILSRFQQRASYTLNKGDVLYVPPGMAHWGVSRDNSICYSIGFRAPSAKELASEWAHSLVAEQQRFQDPTTAYTARSGQHITPAAIQQAKSLLFELLSEPANIADALGTFQSASPHFDEVLAPGWSDLENKLANGALLSRCSGARSFYYCDETTTRVYFNGHAHGASGAQIGWVEQLCSAEKLDLGDIRSHCMHKDDRIEAEHKALLLLALQHQVYEL